MSDSPTFVLDASSKPFQNLTKAKANGIEAFAAMTTAISMAFGLDSEEAVVAAFDTTTKAVKVKGVVDEYTKEMAGHTIGAALIAKLRKGLDIAKDAGGSVTFGINVTVTEATDEKPESVEVKVVPRFGGIAGISATRSGGGGGKGKWEYLDGDSVVTGSLKKYILETYPASHAAKVINEYASRPNSAISAWVAAERGMKNGDSFNITRREKADKADSNSSK